METAERRRAGLGNGEKAFQKKAREAFPILVALAKAQRRIFYSELASLLQMPNPRNLNHVLGAIGGELKNMSEARKSDPIPPLQCLVVNKAHGIPGEGIGWFTGNSEEFKRKPQNERKRIVEIMMSQIFSFSEWDQVLENCGLTPLKIIDENDLLAAADKSVSKYGGKGEREGHKAFKNYIAANPQLFGLPQDVVAEIEHPFISADCLDVLFRNGNEWIGVEVKGPISEDLDLQRGLFQCVKYQALMEAEQKLLQRGINCRTILALTRILPTHLESEKILLDIDVRSFKFA